MNYRTLLILIVILILIFIFYFVYKNKKHGYFLLNQRFYDYKKICPELEILRDNRDIIIKDIENVNNSSWDDWPEKNLYTEDMTWKILPFYGFDMWITHNCNLCPNIVKVIKKIPNLRTALLSKISPDTKLSPHKGWGNLSNNILRSHYGISVPDKCYLYVENEKKRIKDNEIIIFDDSKLHYAENFGDAERTILIIDIKRPDFVKKGNSNVTDTKELTGLINSLKMMNEMKLNN